MPCPASSHLRSDLDFNLTSLALSYAGPKDDRERLEHCWGVLDCGDCHRSQHHCGWCPISGTCLPLPLTPMARAFPLLAPLHHPDICALGSERFELRTAGLGCQVSTITFLTSIVTILVTLAVLLGLWLLAQLAKFGVVVWKGRKGGWALYEDGSEKIWVRKGESWGRWWRRVRGVQRVEEEVVVDEEVRPLLGG